MDGNADRLEGLSPEEVGRLNNLKQGMQAGTVSDELVRRVVPGDPIIKGKVIGTTSQGHDIIEPPSPGSK